MTTSVRYDPLADATLADPYPVYAELRANDPVHWHDRMQCWVLTRYRDCHAVLQDTDGYAADWRRAGERVSEPWLSLQSTDPPDHGPLRSLFMNALRAQDLGRIGEAGRTSSDRRFERLVDRPRFDLITEIIAPVALTTISDLMGIAQPELESFAAISDAIVRSMDAGLTPETAQPGIRARGELSALVNSWFEANPRPGLLQEVAANRDRAAVPDHVVRNTARVVFQSGYSSIVAAAANALLVLLTRPEAIERLRDPALFATGFDELMRFDCAVQGASRIATRSGEIGGVEIKRGDVVLTLFGAANRDPEQFPNPDDLVLDRTPNKHMAFGRGPHTCVGNLFTQRVLQALLKSLLDVGRPLALAGTPRRRRTATMRYLDTLPVAFA